MISIIRRIRDWIFGSKKKEPNDIHNEDDELVIEVDNTDEEYYLLLAFTMKQYPKNEDSYQFYEFRFDPYNYEVYLSPSTTSIKLLNILDEVNSLVQITTSNGKELYTDTLTCFLEDRINELAETVPIYRDKGLKVVYEKDTEEE
jgi:hypothetical protein